MKSLAILLFCSLSFLTLMAMPGCKKLSDDATENGGANTTDTSGITYLALGDSYTIGESVTMEERFPHITAALLQKEGINITGLQYIATTGWTTANLQSAIASKNLQNTFDVVSLLIGVNDQYQGLDTAGYQVRFSQLLEKAIQLTGNRKSRVFVLSIPDYSATPFVPASSKDRVHTEINAFNAINKEISLQQQVTYIDITPASRQAANDLTLLANDHLHYSAKEHLIWAEMLAPLLKSVLQ